MQHIIFAVWPRMAGRAGMKRLPVGDATTMALALQDKSNRFEDSGDGHRIQGVWAVDHYLVSP